MNIHKQGNDEISFCAGNLKENLEKVEQNENNNLNEKINVKITYPKLAQSKNVLKNAAINNLTNLSNNMTNNFTNNNLIQNNSFCTFSKALANLSEIKDQDENMTISCSSNQNEDRTPLGNTNIFLKHLQAQLLSTNSLMLNLAKGSPTAINNNPQSKPILNLLTVPSGDNNSNFTISQNYLINNNFNFTTPKNVNNFPDETPSNRTPLSRVESSIKKYLNSGQDNLSFEEATALYNVYSNYLNQYFHVYRNDNKYSNFTKSFQEHIYNANTNKQNLPLNELLKLLKNPNLNNEQNKGSSNKANNISGPNTPMTNRFNQSGDPLNLSKFNSANSSSLIGNFNNSQFNIHNNFQNLQNMQNLQNNINQGIQNMQNQLMVESSPFLHGNSAFSPIFNTNFFNGGNTITDPKNLNTLTAKTTKNNNGTQENLSFSDYWNIFQYNK